MPQNTPVPTPDAETYYFDVDGLKCRNCSSAIERAVQSLDGVVNVSCDHLSKQLKVVADNRKLSEFIKKRIQDAVVDLGFECQERKDQPKPQKNMALRWILGAFGVTSGIVLMALMLAGITFSLPVMIGIGVISTIVTLFLGWEFYLNAFRTLIKSRELNMNTLFAVSTLTALAVSLAAFFVPGLPMLFDVGLMIFGFRHLGMAIEATVKRSLVSGITFRDYTPQVVRVQQGEGYTLKRISDVKVGDVIQLREGEVIPTDGIGKTNGVQIYDTIITGSRLPRKTVADASLSAGMFLAENSKDLELLVTQTPENSYLAKFDALIQRAKQKPPLKTFAKTVLQYLIPGVLALALLSFAVVALLFPPAIALQCAIAVLVSACPCTLGMILPLSLRVGMNKAFEEGVSFKSTKVLEETGEVAKEINHVVFDLHGTLTKGEPRVSQIISLSHELSKHDLVGLAALIEKGSPHPFAKSICAYAKQKNIHYSQPITCDPSAQKKQGGIKATLNHQTYLVGNRQFLKEHGLQVNHRPDLKAGDSMVYIARGKSVLGAICLSDPLRKDALVVINEFK